MNSNYLQISEEPVTRIIDWSHYAWLVFFYSSRKFMINVQFAQNIFDIYYSHRDLELLLIT
jgi:hypothetical protein